MFTRRFITTTPLFSKSTSNGFWKNVPEGPVDPILGITTAFKNDPFKEKINVGVGAYRTNEGKPWVLPSVRSAEMRVVSAKHDMEYVPIQGSSEFLGLALTLLYGTSCSALSEKRIAALQSLSGTGALRLIAAFLAQFSPCKDVYISNPTWGNHFQIFQHAGLTTKTYKYWDEKMKGIDFSGLISDLQNAKDQSIVVLHACAHNPTGKDLSHAQWNVILDLAKQKNFTIVIDCAYQGFASGDTDKDAYAVRLFANEYTPTFVAQSFAKNMGLYGHRVGTASAICSSQEEAERVLSQMKIFARGMYSSPPIHGARIAATVLGDRALYADWLEEVKTMAHRIETMRRMLVSELKKAGSTIDWSHITDQIGMFCYSGLSEDECKVLTEKHHIYLTLNGRISLTGVTDKNVTRLAQAIHDVTKDRKDNV